METSLSTLANLFAATKQTEGRSIKTVALYRDFLGKFISYLGADATVRQLTIDAARTFIAELQNRTTRYPGHPSIPEKQGGLSPFTVHCYVRTIKMFSAWLHEEGFTRSDTLARLRRPKLPAPVIEILSRDEIAGILSHINPGCSLGARMYVVVLLLLDTGIRASELTTLTLENTYLDDSYIKVCGKGNKERIVPFGAATKEALLRYLTTFRPEDGDTEYAILNTSGQPLSYTALAQSIKRLGVACGVPRLHPHLFRHTFAVNYLMNGGDLMTLKMMLGHSTLVVTQLYMHLAQSHIQVQHNKFSPVDRLGIKMDWRRKRK